MDGELKKDATEYTHRDCHQCITELEAQLTSAREDEATVLEANRGLASRIAKLEAERDKWWHQAMDDNIRAEKAEAERYALRQELAEALETLVNIVPQSAALHRQRIAALRGEEAE